MKHEQFVYTGFFLFVPIEWTSSITQNENKNMWDDWNAVFIKNLLNLIAKLVIFYRKRTHLGSKKEWLSSIFRQVFLEQKNADKQHLQQYQKLFEEFIGRIRGETKAFHL